MRRIVVIGTSGAGKTTLARRLAARLGVPHVELDALNWEAGWTPALPEVFTERVRQAVAAPGWTADGHYGQVRRLVWGAADTVIWLDYSFPRVFWQVLARTVRRVITREVLWNGNRESLRMSFCSRHSILLWVVRTHFARRRSIPVLLARPEFGHLAVHRFGTPRAAEAWLASLPWDSSILPGG